MAPPPSTGCPRRACARSVADAPMVAGLRILLVSDWFPDGPGRLRRGASSARRRSPSRATHEVVVAAPARRAAGRGPAAPGGRPRRAAPGPARPPRRAARPADGGRRLGGPRRAARACGARASRRTCCTRTSPARGSPRCSARGSRGAPGDRLRARVRARARARSAARASASRARAVARRPRLPGQRALRDALAAQGLGRRFTVVPNPVDTDLFAPGSAPAGGEPRLVAVANLVPVKGVAELVEAAGLLARAAALPARRRGRRSERDRLAARIAAARARMSASCSTARCPRSGSRR